MEKEFKKIFIKEDEKKRKEIDLLLIESVKRGESFKRLYEDFTEKEFSSELWEQVKINGITDILNDYESEHLDYINKQPKSVRDVLRANLNVTYEEIEKFTRSSSIILAPFNDNSIKITNYIKGEFVVDKVKESELIELCRIYIDNAIDAEFLKCVKEFAELCKKHKPILNVLKNDTRNWSGVSDAEYLNEVLKYINKDDFSICGIPKIKYLVDFFKKEK